MVGDALGKPCFTSCSLSSFSGSRVPLLLSVHDVSGSDTNTEESELGAVVKHVTFLLTEMKVQKDLVCSYILHEIAIEKAIVKT